LVRERKRQRPIEKVIDCVAVDAASLALSAVGEDGDELVVRSAQLLEALDVDDYGAMDAGELARVEVLF